jgi:hypothetical protein
VTALYALFDQAKSAPAPADPTRQIIDAAASGEVEADALRAMITESAQAQAGAEYFTRLQSNIALAAVRRVPAELCNGGADELIDSLRPNFDEAAAVIADALQEVDISWSPERLASEGTPKQLKAWRALPAALGVIEEIAQIVAQFGPRGTFKVMDAPGGVDLFTLRDEALFTTTFDWVRASDVIKSRRTVLDWRTSPWLRLPLRLNTLDQAREQLRAYAEGAWDALESSRGERGRLTENGFVRDPRRRNPFALSDNAEPAAPEPVAEEDDADILDLEKITG